ncbi:type II toxin-antitoxin system Phd/YefM family antitoxin [bacterium]|nr:type II toxin-antitoxin system Phd/YefM family antitoxin [bacterium]
MKTIAFPDFRKKASGFITEVEHGEAFVIVLHGKPVAEIVPFSDKPTKMPTWKQK